MGDTGPCASPPRVRTGGGSAEYQVRWPEVTDVRYTVRGHFSQSIIEGCRFNSKDLLYVEAPLVVEASLIYESLIYAEKKKHLFAARASSLHKRAGL